MRSGPAATPAAAHDRLGENRVRTVQALMQLAAFIVPASAKERVDGD